MNSRLNLQDIVNLLAEQTGKSKKDTEQFLRTFISVVSEGVFNDRIVKVKGLGTFKIIPVEKRESIDVNTGKRFVIPEHYKFNFSPDKELKELVNKPFSFFETTEVEDGTDFSEIEVTDEVVVVPEINESKEDEPAEELPVVEELQIDSMPVEEPVVSEQSVEEIVEESVVIQPLVAVSEEKVIEPPSVQRDSARKMEKKSSQKGVGALLIILVVALAIIGFVFFMNKQTATQKKESLQTPPAAATVVTQPVDSITAEQNIPVDIQADTIQPAPSEPEPDILATVSIEPGSRLTLIALEYYKHKVFWVYLYEHNKSKISDPNNVPIGTEIVIPNPKKYDIDATDRASLDRAVALQNQILSADK